MVRMLFVVIDKLILNNSGIGRYDTEERRKLD